MENIDLTSFENAINSLTSILIRYEKENDIDLRDAVIQRFEYTYSLSLKMLKRYYKQSELTDEEINGMTFYELIRIANKMGLLKSNLETWDNYRQKRNMTSHTYDEDIANDVVAVIPTFKDEAEFLLNKLKEKLK